MDFDRAVADLPGASATFAIVDPYKKERALIITDRLGFEGQSRDTTFSYYLLELMRIQQAVMEMASRMTEQANNEQIKRSETIQAKSEALRVRDDALAKAREEIETLRAELARRDSLRRRKSDG